MRRRKKTRGGITVNGETYLDFIRFQCSFSSLLLQSLLYAVNDLDHEFTIVDPKELCQLGSAPSPSLEAILCRSRSRNAKLGTQRSHGSSCRE